MSRDASDQMVHKSCHAPEAPSPTVPPPTRELALAMLSGLLNCLAIGWWNIRWDCPLDFPLELAL